MTTAKEARKVLNNLGWTANGIAKRLDGLGITGKRNSPDSCPLANYASTMTGTEVDICFDSIMVVGSSEQLSRAQSKFVRNFDEGKYPELEKM